MADYTDTVAGYQDLVAISIDDREMEKIYFSATDPGESYSALYKQRVWDTVAGGWVYWSTSDIDSAGASYPGPGTYGVDTSFYRVESIVYTRG